MDTRRCVMWYMKSVNQLFDEAQFDEMILISFASLVELWFLNQLFDFALKSATTITKQIFSWNSLSRFNI